MRNGFLRKSLRRPCAGEEWLCCATWLWVALILFIVRIRRCCRYWVMFLDEDMDGPHHRLRLGTGPSPGGESLLARCAGVATVAAAAVGDLGSNMRQRILSYGMPPCHRRPVIAHECSAALLSREFGGVAAFCSLGWTGGGGACIAHALSTTPPKTNPNTPSPHALKIRRHRCHPRHGCQLSSVPIRHHAQCQVLPKAWGLQLA